MYWIIDEWMNESVNFVTFINTIYLFSIAFYPGHDVLNIGQRGAQEKCAPQLSAIHSNSEIITKP